MAKPVRLITYLGANVDRIAVGLVAGLATLGFELSFDPTLDDQTRRTRLLSGNWDMLWGCGFLTRQAIAHDRFTANIVAAPVFAGHEDAVYHSVIIGRPDVSDASSGAVRVARNQPDSWSGWYAMLDHLASGGVARPEMWQVVESGFHANSVAMVAAGEADLAAIDDTVWEDMLNFGGDHSVRVVDRTRDWPSPPITVTSGAVHVVDALIEISNAVEGIDRLVRVDADRYDEMLATAARLDRAAGSGVKLGP